MFKEIQAATINDAALQQLQSFIFDGFLNSKSSVPPKLVLYLQFCSELSITEGIIFKGDKIVMSSSSMHKKRTTEIHYGNRGIEKCKARTRRVMY